MLEVVAKVRMSPGFLVSEYIAGNPGRLGALRFEAMQDDGTVEELVDRNGIKRLTAAGGWKKRWNHWAGLWMSHHGRSP